MTDFTPIMKQYMEIKNKHKDKILFFMLGDFYEFFFKDAEEVSAMLTIALTSRGTYKGKKIPMCGFPKHAADHYIKKIIKNKKKIAICDQISENKKNGLIERKVTKIITPGTYIDITDEAELNYICAVIKKNNEYGIAFLELSTGNFFTNQVTTELNLINEIDKIMPKEIIIEENINININEKIMINKIKTENIKYTEAKKIIKKTIKNIDNIETLNLETSIIAAYVLIQYIIKTQNKLNNINKIEVHKNTEILYIDQNARKNLEIIMESDPEKNTNSLIHTIDKTNTAMGKRLLKKWILTPTTSHKIINNRIKTVSILKNNQNYRKIDQFFKSIADLDKIIYNIISYKIKPIDLKKLQLSLENICKIKQELEKISQNSFLKEIYLNINNHEEIINIIKNSIIDCPAISIADGNVIKDNYDKKLDSYREFLNNINNYIEEYKKEEIGKTSFNKLKISFNSKDGYYIELPQKTKNIPTYYKKIKALANSYRFKTNKLEEIEKNIITSKNLSNIRENRIYITTIYKIKKQINTLKNTISYISILDVLNCFAKNSSQLNWTEPNMSNKNIIKIKEGRHPIIENKIKNKFIPNDITLDDNKKTIIITGANMGGKSTYMRQTAIIVLLAHIGSHVPAKEAIIGKITKILTRIGANDDIANENSTFMLEMKEISNIIEISDQNSLVLIDEIGRGTSYAEGKALAISILTELTKKINPFILFSTHFHDLIKFIKEKDYIRNIFFKTNETHDTLTFLYKWEEGSANNSFGLHIASKAGLNMNIINSAKQYLNEINNNSNNKILELINNCNPDLISPLEALKKLYLMKEILNNKT